MRLTVGSGRFVLIGFVGAMVLAFSGCRGEPNEEGIRDTETVVPPDAPTSMDEYYQQQMQGATQPPS
ncbi:hypothetical protein [Tautonia rosea]|uniref:hypothetical protein n=1 Tax=Tautonia rosea TaxID=2728037 RepID=UPI001474A101|nr:hypothetical protein [Tautonia rosea]